MPQAVTAALTGATDMSMSGLPSLHLHHRCGLQDVSMNSIQRNGSASTAANTNTIADTTKLEKFYSWIKRGGSTGSINQKTTSDSTASAPTGTKRSSKDSSCGSFSNQNGLDSSVAAPTAPSSSDRETTMAKLKDSLSKLREHLDFLQKRKSTTMSDSYDASGGGGGPSGDEDLDGALHMPHGDGPRVSRGGSPESFDETYSVNNTAKKNPKQPDNITMYTNNKNGSNSTHALQQHHHHHTEYDTGDTSLNESDAGSTGTSACSATRGGNNNNDSAYASDRMSHTSMTSQNCNTNSSTSSSQQMNTSNSNNSSSSSGGSSRGHHHGVSSKGQQHHHHQHHHHHQGAAVQRRRVRRGSYTSSDQSSPEYQDGPARNPSQLRKSQSLYELQRGLAPVDAINSSSSIQQQLHPGGKSSRIKSASHAQPKGRQTRKNGGGGGGGISGSDEQLNTTWARRKQYDVRRRMLNNDEAIGPGAQQYVAGSTEQLLPVKRSQSFQDVTPAAWGGGRGGRPTSAGYAPAPLRSASQMSGSSSSVRGSGGGSVKMRRTLPKVPVGTEADIEERKKRMSAEIIRRARAGVSSSSGDAAAPGPPSVPSFSSSSSSLNNRNNSAVFVPAGYNGDVNENCNVVTQVSLEDTGRVPVIRCSPETTSSSSRSGAPTNQAFSGQVYAPTPKYSTPGGHHPYPYSNSTGSTPHHIITNGHESVSSDVDDRYSDTHVMKPKLRPASQGESSQEALQRIINDLRNAASKPYDGSVSSRAGSRSSVNSSCISKEYATGPQTAEEQAEVVYSQLAQWGVLEPNDDDVSSSHQYYNHEYSTQATSNDEEEEEEELRRQDEEEVDEDESIMQTEDEQLGEEQLAQRHYQSSQAYSKSSRTNESVSDSCISDHSDLRVEHPTIHRVLRSCDLVRASLERDDIFTEFGFEIFESTFYDNEGKEPSKRAVFRTPSGRRPLLGRRKGAFMPVAPVNQANQEAGPLLSLVAVDNIVDGSPADRCGNLQEGDYIIEVNGLYVVDADVERVRAEFAETGNTLDLVVARTHEMGVDRLQSDSEGTDSAEVRKDLERLKLKYDAMKQDAERSQDTIADLKLELKDRDRQIGQLDSDLRMRDDQFADAAKTLRAKDEEVAEWKYEANHRNVELARLKYETKQKDDRIAQLRRLLIQQTELMQMHQVASRSQGSGSAAELDDFEEHVSAV